MRQWTMATQLAFPWNYPWIGYHRLDCIGCARISGLVLRWFLGFLPLSVASVVVGFQPFPPSFHQELRFGIDPSGCVRNPRSLTAGLKTQYSKWNQTWSQKSTRNGSIIADWQQRCFFHSSGLFSHRFRCLGLEWGSDGEGPIIRIGPNLCRVSRKSGGRLVNGVEKCHSLWCRASRDRRTSFIYFRFSTEGWITPSNRQCNGKRWHIDGLDRLNVGSRCADSGRRQRLNWDIGRVTAESGTG